MERRFAAWFQIAQLFGILGLEDGDASISGIFDQDIAAPLAVLLVRFHAVASSGENTSQKRMVEIFLVVVVADRLAQEFVHLVCQSFRVTGPDGIKEGLSILFFGSVSEPILNRRFKDFSNFCIGDHQSGCALRQRLSHRIFPDLGQVAGCIENAPQILFGRMQIIVGQVLPNLLHDTAAGHQRFQLLCDISFCVVDERADDRVVAGVFPVAGWLGFGVALKVTEIIHHVPGTINVQVSKVIPIVPGFDSLGLICQVRVA